MKKTPLYDRHVEDKAKIVEFAGYMMPIQFDGIIEEHHHVREKVGVFDVSHMGEVYVIGNEATQFLDYLLTNNIKHLTHDTCLYTMMCYENGTVVDDLLVYKYNDAKYLLVINASNDDKDVEWIRSRTNGFEVEIQHKSDEFGELAVQGPDSEALLTRFFGPFIEEIKFFTFREFIFDDIPLIISRTGYTGEDGFEIFIPNGLTLDVYERLFEVEGFELKPIGLGARDTLRFEVALPLYGHELSDHITPVEARLTHFVDFEKTEFIGKEAMLEKKKNPNHLVLVGFMLGDKGIARENYPILNSQNEEIGYVSTGYKLDGYDRSIGLGFVPKPFGKLGTEINIGIRKKIIPATVIQRKFYNKKYKK